MAKHKWTEDIWSGTLTTGWRQISGPMCRHCRVLKTNENAEECCMNTSGDVIMNKTVQTIISDHVKSLPELSEGKKLIAKAGAEYVRGRLGLPPKNAGYVLVRFLKPFIQARWLGMGGRDVGVAYLAELEGRWPVALYDLPTLIDPAAVLLLRFETLVDAANVFAAGRSFTWAVGIEDVAICQVLSAKVMEVFKASDPFTSKRIVGFSRLGLQEPPEQVVAAQAETQDVTPELIDQSMTNTSTLPTVSGEELALLKAGRAM